MIQIDGAVGEGGGQILRSALTLSLVSQQPFHIKNVRAQRPKPGLRPQHLQAVNAAAAISQARVAGARSGSQSLTFEPSDIRPGEYAFAIKTAGSTSLVLQTIFIPLSLAHENSQVTIEGGTHVPFSPCFEYVAWTWMPLLNRLGFEADISLERAGFFPQGDGLIKARIMGDANAGRLDLMERGPLERLVIYSAVANLPHHIAERQARKAQALLVHLEVPFDVKLGRYRARHQGTLLLVQPESENGYASFFALGERGKTAEQIAVEAVDLVRKYLRAPGVVDPHLADQILIPLALAKSRSSFSTTRITAHLRTNAWVIEKFGLAKIDIDGALGHSGVVHVQPQSKTIQH